MKKTLIAAVAQNGVIGNKNEIPWHVPADFKHFSETTRHHAVVMGSKTWDSLPEKFRPLPNRINVVVTSKTDYPTYPHTFFVASLEAAESLLTDGPTPIVHPDNEIFIMGGASIYEQTIGDADRLLISEIPLKPEGDTVFPKIGPEWKLVSTEKKDGFTLKDYRKLYGVDPS